MLRLMWRAAFFWWRTARGYRLRPWRSPYLRWRMETYSGIPAAEIGFRDFCRYAWEHRRDLACFLAWARRMK